MLENLNITELLLLLPVAAVTVTVLGYFAGRAFRRWRSQASR
ncbi:hypothetical protein [Catellatospora sichuanensis]|nr:hypothetical protein [Catellatospora sichuanensis]